MSRLATMAKVRAQKLKVFRTPIGFHDALVAAPSQKAALEAWGADSNLFAQGIAERVTDPALIEQALESPWRVIKLPRGSAGDHLAAVEKATTSKANRTAKPAAIKGKKPDRAALEKAEHALAAANKTYRAEMRSLEVEQRALDRKKREATRRHELGSEKLEREREEAQRAYDRAMRAWRN